MVGPLGRSENLPPGLRLVLESYREIIDFTDDTKGRWRLYSPPLLLFPKALQGLNKKGTDRAKF